MNRINGNIQTRLAIASIAVLGATTVFSAPAANAQSIAGCSNEIPIGQTVIDELRHDDGGGVDFRVTAGVASGAQRTIVHANRFVNGGGTMITHICINTLNPDGMAPGGQGMELFIATTDDLTFGDIRPGPDVWSSNETIAVGWQLIEVNPPITANAVTWIGARFPTADATTAHMGTAAATDFQPDGVTPTPEQSFVGILNHTGGQDIWTDYDDIGQQGYQGYRAIIRGLHVDAASCAAADLVITNAQNLETTEGGGTAQFDVALTGPVPLNNVIVILGTTDSSEGDFSPFGLTFTPGNAGVPQTVTVTGQDDNLTDGDIPYSITLLTSSLDNCYHQINGSVQLINRDDETAPCGGGVTASTNAPPGLATGEDGTAVTFELFLAGPVPTDPIDVIVDSTNPAEGVGDPIVMTVLPADAAGPIPITVLGVDDPVADGDQLYDVVIFIQSADGCYDGVSAPPVTLVNLDDDPPCPEDFTGPNGVPDGVVDTFDLLQMLSDWGPCAGCVSDINSQNNVDQVDTFDLLDLLAAWGPC